MPSSSTHDTSQEFSYLHYFKMVYTRFYFHGYYTQAEAICSFYSVLLERPKAALIQDITADEYNWNLWKNHIRPQKPSESIWSAGTCLSDTAAMLTRFGREDESKRYYGYAEEVQKMATEVEAKEERRRSRDGYIVIN